MGLEEKVRRTKAIEQIGRVMDAYSDDWGIEETPGALVIVYDEGAYRPTSDSDGESVASLRARASELEIPGRSSMTRDELVAAIDAAE